MFGLQKYFPNSSRIVYGCMGLGGTWDTAATTNEQRHAGFQAIDAALEQQINIFDHADIYTKGKAEQLFGDYLRLNSGLREKLILQSKCGIRFADNVGPGRYDFSADYIIKSVEASLKRLQTDYLDILLLHRPDPLMEPDEVAKAFSTLRQTGKVRYFGVSNFGWPQLQWLQHALPDSLIVNQLQMSLANIDWLEHNVLTGMVQGASHHFGFGTIEHCLQNNVQIQAWGSLAQGIFSGGAKPTTQAQITTAQKVIELAEMYQTKPEAIVLSWLMRHPANIQPVIGTVNPLRIAACADALQVHLSREHWYALYVTSRGAPMP
jgi:predicted oxidoreductase